MADERIAIPLRARGKQWPFVDANGARTRIAQSERIVKDNQGRLWFAQSGHWMNFALAPDVQNYSRIVSYDPLARKFCIYPVPDNNAAVMGIAWDESRNLVWFSQSGNNAIVAFNPDKLRDCDTYNRYRWGFDSDGKPVQAFPVAYCNWPGEVTCMRKYLLPVNEQILPNQLVVQQPGQPDPGSIWITEFLGGHIGRLDPATGEYQRFPVDTLNYRHLEGPKTFYHRLHQILVHPLSGDL
ncbi:MAG: hypothetical protein R3E50_15365, partial [Halioglobus sp.]